MRKDRGKRMKIKISKEKLQRVLNDHHDSMSGLSKKLGKSETFISQVFSRYGCEVDDAIANLICLLYDVQPEDIRADVNKTDTQKAFAILREENKRNTEKVLKSQEEIIHLLEKILTKVNANTLQIERIKQEAIVPRTDPVHEARVFLKVMLENGRMNAMTIQAKAEMAGIALANLTKAKQELNVKTDMTGSGRNQKIFWYL